MSRRRGHGRRRRRHAPGTAPGTLRIDPEAPQPRIAVIAYGPEEYVEQEIQSAAEISAFLSAWPVVWVNVDGLGSEALLLQLGELFHFHRLALEDVVNLGQRAKVERHGDHLFVVARMAPAELAAESQQLSLFLDHRSVMTFQEQSGDCFDEVRTRIRAAGRQIRSSGADYLAYALIDAVIDAYFPVLEALHDKLEELEIEVLESPARDTVQKIHHVKGRLQLLRREIGPHREAINALLRDLDDFVTPATAVYLRDCHDHVLWVIERLEAYREQCGDLMGTYLSSVSNRMNEVMKVLTIIATIFIPLSFIAGLYGMNFNPSVSAWNMPELDWAYGYPMALGLMGAVGVGLVWYFWRKGWFD
jgi:magnesium transporter